MMYADKSTLFPRVLTLYIYPRLFFLCIVQVEYHDILVSTLSLAECMLTNVFFPRSNPSTAFSAYSGILATPKHGRMPHSFWIDCIQSVHHFQISSSGVMKECSMKWTGMG